MVKATPKHEKMYKNGPSLEKDDDGIPYIKKGSAQEEAPTEEAEGEAAPET